MFQEQIKQLRLSLSMTQAAFGSQLGVSKQCVSNWEKGIRRPSIETLTRIALTFHVSTDSLLGIEELCNSKYVDVTGLTETQIHHIELFVSDLRTQSSAESQG